MRLTVVSSNLSGQIGNGQMARVHGVLVGGEGNSVERDQFDGQLIDIECKRGARIGCRAVSFDGELRPHPGVVFE